MEYCEFCGNKVFVDAVICPKCGRQLKELVYEDDENYLEIDSNKRISGKSVVTKCEKWVAFFLCLFLGYIGAHKFYEGKNGLGVLYIFSVGLFGIGVLVDLITILGNPDPYYIRREIE